jgi:hypothetical protein
MSQHVDFERIKALADEYTAHAPSQETPTCTLILGIVSLADRDFSQGQCGDDCIRINLLDAWSIYSGKPAETFTYDNKDYASSMALASCCAVNAYHKRQNIAVEIGGLEQIQLERIHFLMRLLGYRIEMSLLGSEGHGDIWRSLDDAERRLCYLRDITSYELVLYMFQDIVGMSPEEMLESFGNADTIAISSPDATTRVQADITEMRRLFATAESSQDAS